MSLRHPLVAFCLLALTLTLVTSRAAKATDIDIDATASLTMNTGYVTESPYNLYNGLGSNDGSSNIPLAFGTETVQLPVSSSYQSPESTVGQANVGPVTCVFDDAGISGFATVSSSATGGYPSLGVGEADAVIDEKFQVDQIEYFSLDSGFSLTGLSHQYTYASVSLETGSTVLVNNSLGNGNSSGSLSDAFSNMGTLYPGNTYELNAEALAESIGPLQDGTATYNFSFLTVPLPEANMQAAIATAFIVLMGSRRLGRRIVDVSA